MNLPERAQGAESRSLTAELLDRARTIGPILAQHAGYAETTGMLAEPAFCALRDSEMFKLWRPKSLGGVELDPVSHALVSEVIASFDTASAWMIMACSNTAFDLRMANTGFVEQVYADDPEAFICATLNKLLVAEQTPGGYRISGEVAFASGCRHAHWVGHLAVVHHSGRPALDGAGQPILVLVYHPRANVQILSDWDSLGLRGTSSNTIRLNDAFVPEERSVTLAAFTGSGGHYVGPLYRCPIALLSSTIATPALGALRAALATFSAIAASKVPFATKASLQERGTAQVHYGRALSRYRAARAYLLAELERAYEKAREGEAFTLTDKAALVLASVHAAEVCAEAARALATAAGSSAVYKSCGIERALRDLETLRQHALVSESRFASVAQVEWQLPIDLPLLALD